MKRRGVVQAAAAGLLLSAGLGTAGAVAPLRWPALTLADGRPLPPGPTAGRRTLLVFWATWCGYCHQQNRGLQALWRDRERWPDLDVLALAVDGDLPRLQQHLRLHGFTFPAALDNNHVRPQVTDRRVLPTTVLVGADGQPGLVLPGAVSEEDLRRLAAG